MYYARELRRSCYERLRDKGILDERFPTLVEHMTSDARYELLLKYRERGYTDREAFAAMGQDPDTYLYVWRKRRREKGLPI